MVFHKLDCMEDLMWLLRVGSGKLSAPMLLRTFVERSVEFSLPRPFVRFRVSSPSPCQGI